ncbi:MAG: pilin [Minisyncoccota bacterium]
MKNYFIILGLAIIFLGVGPSVFATEEVCVPGPDGYCALTSLPGISDATGRTDINAYVKGMFQLAIGLAGGLAVLRIITGGIKYMTTDAFGEKGDAKQTIQDAVIGLLLAISAYTILATVNPKLVEFEFGIEGLKLGAPISSTAGTAGPIAPITIDGVTLKVGDTWPNDSTDRTDLQNRGISWNNFNCTKIGDTGCTSLYKIGETVINGLETLKKACVTCVVRISGGTEYWLHSEGTAHRPGGNVVDLSLNSSLQTFLQTKGVKATGSGCAPGDERYTFGGGTYVKETPKLDHWHVCF